MSSDLMKEDLIKGLLDIFSGDIEAIMLYDSVARNESTSESDIDIAVIIKREMDDEKNGNMRCIEILQYFEVSYLNKKQYFKILHQRLYGISKI